MSIITSTGKIKRPTHEDVYGITMSTTKPKQPVTFKHTGAVDVPQAPHGTRPVPQRKQWEYQSITAAETTKLAGLGLSGWEAYSVVQMPGVMRIFLKREML